MVVRRLPTHRVADPLSEPTFEESHADFCRFMEELPSLDLGNTYPNEFIAYYDGRVVDHDSDSILLCNRAASHLNVHPARIVIYYVLVQFWAE
ncbi:MAG TPA: hypothetical protein VGI99_13215 [Gemmataceae bacterium]